MNAQDRYWLAVLVLHGLGWLLHRLLLERILTPLHDFGVRLSEGVLWVCVVLLVLTALRPQDKALRTTTFGTQAVLTLVMVAAYALGRGAAL